MGALEDISKKLDSKKKTLKKSIFSLVTDWREVEKDLESTRKSFQYLLSEHQDGETSLLKETYLEMKERELNEREVLFKGLTAKIEYDREELKVVENMVLGRLREVGLTEERLELWERRVEEREKSVSTSELWVPLMEDRKKAVEMKEREVALLREDLELKEKDIEMLLKVSETRENELDKRERQLNVKRTFVDELQSSVKCLEKGLEAKMKDFSVAEQRLMEKHDVREKQLELKEKQCKSENELLEIGKKESEQKMKEFEARKIKEIEARKRDLEHRNCAMKEIEERLMEQKQYQSNNKALDLKIEEFEERMKVFEIREKELALKNKKVNDGDSFELAVELDGLDVHILLNGIKIDLSSPDEVSKALRLSGDPAFLVLSAMKVLYPPYLMTVDMRFDGSVGKSCILLLEQLIIISPVIQSQQREDALKLAIEWKDKISLESSLEVTAFLYFLASFDLASSFDTDEVMKLFEIVDVAEHAQVLDLCRRLGLKDRMPVSKSYTAQDEKEDGSDLIIKAQGQADPLTNLLKCLKGCNPDPSNESQFPMLLKQSSDAAELVLDALHFISDSKERKIPVVKSVYYLLQKLASVSPTIKSCIRKRASKFALDWKSTLTDSNSWEVFAFLLFVGVYGLFSSFGAKYVLSLLEVHSQLVKETSGIIRTFKLEHKAPDFIMNLVENKQRLLAFDYVYEFNLVDKIPPVALLKKHALDSKLAAMKCKNGQTETKELDGVIYSEISTLQDVIKCILDHSLESEYSPDMLRERIKFLEVERENLKKCMPADFNNSNAKPNPIEQELNRKRPASSDHEFAFARDVQPSPSKKMRHKSNDRSLFNVHPFPFQHQHAAHHFFTGDGTGNHWPYYDNPVPIPPIFFPPYQ